MNKPLLQWKREIEEDIAKINDVLEDLDRFPDDKSLISDYEQCFDKKKEQLQMIDDIIEQKEEFVKWLKVNIKEYEELRDSDQFNECMKSIFSSSILNYESVLNKLGE